MSTREGRLMENAIQITKYWQYLFIKGKAILPEDSEYICGTNHDMDNEIMTYSLEFEELYTEDNSDNYNELIKVFAYDRLMRDWRK